MSHLPERKEKICLNCNAGLIGRYCHKCGQQNLEPKESVWHFVVHFFNDFTHFDGKFFTTLKDLLFRPGFLSREYMLGRRERYLNPVRMYLFTSFFFFLVFFSFVHLPEPTISQDNESFEVIKQLPDSTFGKATAKFNKGVPMSRPQFDLYIDSLKSLDTVFIRSNAGTDNTAAANRDASWLETRVNKKMRSLRQKYPGDRNGLVRDFIQGFTHRFPQMLFFSLPLVALILHLLYIRRKEFYYVSHAVFVIHLFIFQFLAMLAKFGLDGLYNVLHWKWLSALGYIILGTILFYLYKAMRNFYGQRRGLTIVKYFLFLFLNLVLFIFISVVFVFWSLMMM